MLGFSRKYRLVSKRDFQAVFAKPRKATRRSLLVLYCPNSLSHARLGLVIAKQHVKRAVDRNYIRRILRESFRSQKEALKGLDIVVLMRSEWSPSGKQTLRDDIQSIWQTLNHS